MLLVVQQIENRKQKANRKQKTTNNKQRENKQQTTNREKTNNKQTTNCTLYGGNVYAERGVNARFAKVMIT